LVITLIRESPLSATWFQQKDQKDSSKQEHAAISRGIRSAFVPIENRRAPEFPGVFEVMMGWCLRTGNDYLIRDEEKEDDEPAS